MKKIVIGCIAMLLVLGVAPLALHAEDANPFALNANDVAVTISDVQAVPLELNGFGKWNGGQLEYDLTQCGQNPFDMPSLHTVPRACAKANLYIDLRSFPSKVTTEIVYAFNFGSWAPIVAGPVQLDPGTVWAVSVEFSFSGAARGVYAAGAIYNGKLLANPVMYSVTVQ